MLNLIKTLAGVIIKSYKNIKCNFIYGGNDGAAGWTFAFVSLRDGIANSV